MAVHLSHRTFLAQALAFVALASAALACAPTEDPFAVGDRATPTPTPTEAEEARAAAASHADTHLGAASDLSVGPRRLRIDYGDTGSQGGRHDHYRADPYSCATPGGL